MVKTTTTIDRKIQNDLSRKYILAASVYIAVGIAGVLIYALRDIIFSAPSKWQSAFLIFIIPLGLGILIDFLVIKTKRTTIVEERVVDYAFSDEGIEINTHKTSGDTSAHIDYDKILKIKQTKHFLFIYLSGDVVYPVDIRKLSEAETTELKNYLKLEENKK